MNRDNNSGAGIAIFLASLVLVAMSAKADEKEAQNQNLRLVWTSECPKGMPSTHNSNMCKRRVYVDDSIKLGEDLTWQEVEDIQRIAYDWRERFKYNLTTKKRK